MDGFERITGREHDGLVEKCQENGWLKVGGFDWQDDPFLEEYPYEFSRTDSVDRLREAFSCRWAHSPLRHCSGVASHMSRMARSNRSGSWAMAPKLQLSKPVHASPSRLSVHHSSPPFTCWMNARSR